MALSYPALADVAARYAHLTKPELAERIADVLGRIAVADPRVTRMLASLTAEDCHVIAARHPETFARAAAQL